MTEKKRKAILIVDDVQMNIEILLALLGREYDITTARSGKEVLTITRAEKPDLILLDVVMPEMNGFEVCTQLKVDKELKDIPVVFLSALNEEKEHQQGLALGAVDFIEKPFDIDVIQEKVKNILLK
jgi:two-component system, sensor histidine kinase and response regulator